MFPLIMKGRKRHEVFLFFFSWKEILMDSSQRAVKCFNPWGLDLSKLQARTLVL